MTASSGSSPKPGPRPSGDDAAAQAKDAAGQAKDAAKDAIDKATDTAKDAAAKAKDAATQAADTAKDKAKDAGDVAKDAADSAKDTVADAGDKAKDALGDATDKAKDAADKAKEAAGSAKHRIADATGNARDTAREKIDEHRRGDAPKADVPLTKPLRAADDRAARSPVSVTAPAATVVDPDAEPSIGQLVSTATEAVSTLVRSEIELAKLELRSTVKNGLTGAGMFIAALVILVFSLTFGFITLAEGIIALGLDRWLGYLIVFGFLLLLVGALVFLGIRKVKKVKAPEKTIRTTKETVDYLKSHTPSQG